MTENTDNTRLVTIVLAIVGALVIFPILFMSFGMMGGMWGGGMWGSGMWGGGMWGDGTVPGWVFVVGIVMRLLFLAALIGVGYLIYRMVAGSESDSDRALEELRLAYARGELTDDEYEHRRDALERDT